MRLVAPLVKVASSYENALELIPDRLSILSQIKSLAKQSGSLGRFKMTSAVNHSTMDRKLCFSK